MSKKSFKKDDVDYIFKYVRSYGCKTGIWGNALQDKVNSEIIEVSKLSTFGIKELDVLIEDYKSAVVEFNLAVRDELDTIEGLKIKIDELGSQINAISRLIYSRGI